jgi:hypothetical protein
LISGVVEWWLRSFRDISKALSRHKLGFRGFEAKADQKEGACNYY